MFDQRRGWESRAALACSRSVACRGRQAGRRCSILGLGNESRGFNIGGCLWGGMIGELEGGSWTMGGRGGDINIVYGI